MLTLSDIRQLFAITKTPRWSPEARLAASGQIRALWALAAEDRRQRPDIDLELVDAYIGGLDIEGWRHPWRFCCLAEGDSAAALRDEELPEMSLDRG